MKAMSEQECLKNGIKWTPERARVYYAFILAEKRRLLKEMLIPFPAEIEKKFNAVIKNGDKDPEVYLNHICRNYIHYAYDNYAKVLCDYINTESEKKLLTKQEIIRMVGRYGFEELCNAGMVRLRISEYRNEMYEVV